MPELVRVRLIAHNNVVAGHWVLREEEGQWRLSIWQRDEVWTQLQGAVLDEGPRMLVKAIQGLAANIWTRATADVAKLRANPSSFRRPGFRPETCAKMALKNARDIEIQLETFRISCDALVPVMHVDLHKAGWAQVAPPVFPWNPKPAPTTIAQRADEGQPFMSGDKP